MAIEVTCPSCGTVGNVPDQTRGRNVKCPKCGSRFQVPVSDAIAGYKVGHTDAAQVRKPSVGEEIDCTFCGKTAQFLSLGYFLCSTCMAGFDDSGRPMGCPTCGTMLFDE